MSSVQFSVAYAFLHWHFLARLTRNLSRQCAVHFLPAGLHNTQLPFEYH